jgi:DNA mismatch endonuclease, patch repair protein
MPDILTKAERSARMSSIRSQGTRPELLVRSLLHREGLRFRVNCSTLPGKPDLVFPRYRAVVFVHGCFWHRHQGCKDASSPASHVEEWEEKFKATLARDRKHVQELRSLGWRVFVIWTCSLKPPTVARVSCTQLAVKIRRAQAAS